MCCCKKADSILSQRGASPAQGYRDTVRTYLPLTSERLTGEHVHELIDWRKPLAPSTPQSTSVNRHNSSRAIALHTTTQTQVVNQLLSKLDGIHALDNVLVIGLTNRKDMIDAAVLRPGRLELHVEVGAGV